METKVKEISNKNCVVEKDTYKWELQKKQTEK